MVHMHQHSTHNKNVLSKDPLAHTGVEKASLMSTVADDCLFMQYSNVALHTDPLKPRIRRGT